ncbi:MAG: hypothetical protein PHF57_14215, partial [Methanoregula sp.]|nr:hypothetical protein [Methanoregula sp.]
MKGMNICGVIGLIILLCVVSSSATAGNGENAIIVVNETGEPDNLSRTTGGTPSEPPPGLSEPQPGMIVTADNSFFEKEMMDGSEHSSSLQDLNQHSSRDQTLIISALNGKTAEEFPVPEDPSGRPLYAPDSILIRYRPEVAENLYQMKVTSDRLTTQYRTSVRHDFS